MDKEKDMTTSKFRICRINPGGALELSPMTVSAETAAKRDPAAFLALYEEMRLVYLRMFSQQRMELGQQENGQLNHTK